VAQARAAACLSQVAGAELRWVLYDHESEIRPRVAALLAAGGVDGLLLGQLPYGRCHDLVTAELAVTVVRIGAVELASGLARAGATGLPLTPVSIDTFDETVVDEVVQSIGLDARAVQLLPYREGEPAPDIASRHRAFVQRTSGYVISCRSEVARELRPTLPVITPETAATSVRAAAHELLLRIQARRQEDLRVLAGVFLAAPRWPGDDLDRARVALLQHLLEAPEYHDAWMQDRGLRQIVVFGNQALFQRASEGWVVVPALRTAEARLGMRVSAGFGFGSSARMSVLLAEQAANRAAQEGGGCAYLMGERGLIVGPMGREREPLTFTFREHTPALEALGRRVGLSAVTVSRLAALDRRLDGRPVTPAELANALAITETSGRRLLRTMTAHDLAEAIGSEQLTRRGRPTRLFRLRVSRAAERENDAGTSRTATGAANEWTTAPPAGGGPAKAGTPFRRG
ncbi:MAG: hypothetical protein WAM30_15915, partial [Candidatus Dormiibacterota bacterium]